MIRNRIDFALLFALAPFAAPAQSGPPIAAVREVVDNYHGVSVRDPYRYMETPNDPETARWMKAQADYTRSVLDGLPGRAAMRKRLEELLDSGPILFGARRAGKHYFYLKRQSGENAYKLYERTGEKGPERLLVDPGARLRLTDFAPSEDGERLAYLVAAGGSEDAVLHIVEVPTGRDLGETIDRARFADPSWAPDGRSFFYWRQAKHAEADAPGKWLLDSRCYRHYLGTDPEKDAPVFGRGLQSGVDFPASYLPFVWASPASRFVVGFAHKGAGFEGEVYVAPLDQARGPETPWRKVAGIPDGVRAAAAHGEFLYLLSHRNSPRYELLRTRLAAPDLSRAEVVVPAGRGVLTGFAVAADAIYVREMAGGVSHLKRMPYSKGKVEEVTLPNLGTLTLTGDPLLPGALFSLTGWTLSPRICRYDPQSGKVTDTGLQPPSSIDMSSVEALEVEARSEDGTMVPLSILLKRGLAKDGSHPTLLTGYGGYGVSQEPAFFGGRMPWFERGGIVAIAHVRGGGEYGEEWHIGGQRANKQNSISDFIACGEYLIEHGYTSPAHLGAEGASAGGILVGNALVQKPDLFTAIVSIVGVNDLIRFESTPGGPANVPELGTIQKPDEFAFLYKVSAYHHVQDGAKYPAVLLMTGINDPRVPYWMVAKMAARLQAATASGKPVLLRVDYDAGHGANSMSQGFDMAADRNSFLFWQLGGGK
jgi:prolyl oligopeptidase